MLIILLLIDLLIHSVDYSVYGYTKTWIKIVKNNSILYSAGQFFVSFWKECGKYCKTISMPDVLKNSQFANTHFIDFFFLIFTDGISIIFGDCLALFKKNFYSMKTLMWNFGFIDQAVRLNFMSFHIDGIFLNSIKKSIL